VLRTPRDNRILKKDKDQNKKYYKTFINFSIKRSYTSKVTQAHESYFARTKVSLEVISNQSTLSLYAILYAIPKM